MKIIADNKIIKDLRDQPEKVLEEPLFKTEGASIQLEWPSFLEFIGYGDIFSLLPTFDDTHKLFQAMVETLSQHDEDEVVFHIYDHLFAENLKEISALPQLKAPVLLQAIRKQKENPKYKKIEHLLSESLDPYDKRLFDDTDNIIHDLVLYLGWDRMCVSVSYLFNYQTEAPKYLEAIKGVGDCLIESFQHISNHGRTAPGISRMVETLFYYEMREEIMHHHPEPVWEMLTKSFPGIKPQDQLIDFLYIDNNVIPFEKYVDDEYATLDSKELVQSRIALSDYIMRKLNYALSPKKIITL